MELTITMKVRTEGEATTKEVEDYIAFEVGASGAIESDNPFHSGKTGIHISNVSIGL